MPSHGTGVDPVWADEIAADRREMAREAMRGQFEVMAAEDRDRFRQQAIKAMEGDYGCTEHLVLQCVEQMRRLAIHAAEPGLLGDYSLAGSDGKHFRFILNGWIDEETDRLIDEWVNEQMEMR